MASRCCTIPSRHCAPTASAALALEVLVVEPTGADTQLYCRFNGHNVTVDGARARGFSPGDRLMRRRIRDARIVRGVQRQAPGCALIERTFAENALTGRSDECEQASRRAEASATLATGAVVGPFIWSSGPLHSGATSPKGGEATVLRWNGSCRATGTSTGEREEFTETFGIEVRVDHEVGKMCDRSGGAANTEQDRHHSFDQRRCRSLSGQAGRRDRSVRLPGPEVRSWYRSASSLEAQGALDRRPLGCAGNAIVYAKARQSRRLQRVSQDLAGFMKL